MGMVLLAAKTGHDHNVVLNNVLDIVAKHQPDAQSCFHASPRCQMVFLQ